MNALVDTVQLEPTDAVAALSNRLFQIRSVIKPVPRKKRETLSLEKDIGSKRETLLPTRPVIAAPKVEAAPVEEENPEDFCNPNEEEKVLLKKVFAKKFSMRKPSKK